ncbi:dnase1 protein [Rutstroemia sp. NJR-2017a BVV2]|nr:dnase1 protein [Rutstroemia sp. NJR-2017a BVV2]
MQFSTLFAAASALFTLASAGTVHFVNQDSTTRTIVFTPNPGYATIESLIIVGLATGKQEFPTGWIGNWYSVSEGATDIPGMLGEVAFDSYAGATYFDVSAIVNPDDGNGVKEIFPLHSSSPVSGCQSFPCANAYNKWDDIQTQSTDGSELVCLLGNLSGSQRRSLRAKLPREFVEGVVV